MCRSSCAGVAIATLFCLGNLQAQTSAADAPDRSPVEWHVAETGADDATGTADLPLRSVGAAARRARPGDTITVHAGVYRERIDPPRGGRSAATRITYRAAPGETVVIKGSEVVTGWQRIESDTWMVTVPNSLFGEFNPFADRIAGDWFNGFGRDHHTGAVYRNGEWLIEAAAKDEVLREMTGDTGLWFAEIGGDSTTVWAQFPGFDPASEAIEINVRQAVFYPSGPGIHWLTVRGFTMEHAATPWAPPTAEQIGLLGTHWSHGWIIEDNIIRYSTCTGITLGKYGDAFDNTSQNRAEGYVQTVERALDNAWAKEHVGGHVVRNNEISHCEQAGLVGSLGAVFSEITGNDIHHIHVRRRFGGAEMAGIKLHAPIDVVIADNHIHHCCRGIWLDWMTQGTRVTRNVLHDNAPWADLFVEVNHGPFLVDHNLLLSPYAIRNGSQGGAYAHNLVAGRVTVAHGERRKTPFHPAHSTAVAGLAPNPSGDDRLLNNLFIGTDLTTYDAAALPVVMAGNVYLSGARPSKHEARPVVRSDLQPDPQLVHQPQGWVLLLEQDRSWADSETAVVRGKALGTAHFSAQPFVDPRGRPYRLDTDLAGRDRQDPPSPGPFALYNAAAGMERVAFALPRLPRPR